MTSALYEQYLTAKEQNSGKYARDLAAILNVSEAELTHARVGHGARRLNADARTLLAALESVGEVKAITRNEYAVHEQLGSYENQHLHGHAGLILNPGSIDLRLFLQHWSSAFTLTEDSRNGERHSVQFFDAQGDALHKVYTTPNTDMAAWNDLIGRFVSDENPALEIQLIPHETKNSRIDNAVIDSEWRAMTDVHQFFQLLGRHNLSRQQAFAAGGDALA